MDIVRVETGGDEARYEAFLSKHPGAMLYYTLAYRNLLRCHLRCEAGYYQAVDETGAVRGILPTMSRTGRFGRVVNSLPFFGSHGGVLADSAEAETALWGVWDDLGAGAAAATVVLNPFCSQNPPITFTHRDYRIGSMTRLPESPELDHLLARIDSSARRNYQKASRLGLEVAEENDQIEILHAIHVENIDAVKGRAKELSFFRQIARHFTPGREYKIYTARSSGEVVAALLVFLAGRCVEYFTPATRLVHRELQPSALLLIAAMQDAVTSGYRLWNWGGSWVSQDGVARFKGKWGGDQRPYSYFTRVNGPDILYADPATLLNEYPYFFLYPFASGRASV